LAGSGATAEKPRRQRRQKRRADAARRRGEERRGKGRGEEERRAERTERGATFPAVAVRNDHVQRPHGARDSDKTKKEHPGKGRETLRPGGELLARAPMHLCWLWRDQGRGEE
jgi:hypothetical protein